MLYEEIVALLESNIESQGRYQEWLSFLNNNNLNVSIPCMHVYGKNNVENISHYLNEIYINAGYKVGYFTHERKTDYLSSIKINNEHISKEDFVRIFNNYENEILTAKLTSFEILTLISSVFFKEQNVQLIINESFENGINFYDLAVKEKDTFVFNDFENYDIKNIFQKSKFISRKLEKKAMNELRKYSLKKQIQLINADPPKFESYSSPYFYFDYDQYKKLEILSPSKELLDAATLSLEAIKANYLDFSVSENAIRKGLSSLPLPCRFEKIHNVFVDEIYSEEQLSYLLDGIERIRNGKDVCVLFASEKKTKIMKILSSFKHISKEVVLTTYDGKTIRKEDDYSSYLEDCLYQENWKIALHYLLRNNKNAIILATGSREFAYLVKEYLEKYE